LAKPFIFSSYLNLFKCTTKYFGKVFKRVRFYASCFEPNIYFYNGVKLIF
jgi:hypothetical protein